MADVLDAAIDDVWSAPTDPARLAHWLGDVEGDVRLGGEFHARFFASGAEGTKRVEACEPPTHLLVSGDHPIEVTLTAEGAKTAVVWEERGMPEHLLAACGAGIQIHVEDLAAYLAGHDPRATAADVEARWDALVPAYEALR